MLLVGQIACYCELTFVIKCLHFTNTTVSSLFRYKLLFSFIYNINNSTKLIKVHKIVYL